MLAQGVHWTPWTIHGAAHDLVKSVAGLGYICSSVLLLVLIEMIFGKGEKF